MNVDAIDFVGFNRHDRPRDALSADLVVKALSLLKGAGLGIGQAIDAAIGMEDHGAGHDWTGQATATDFVNACDRHEAVAVQAVLDIASCRDLGHSGTQAP